MLKELDASSREVLRHVLDLIRHAGEEIHQILSPSLCRPVDGEFMSLLHISGLDQIRGMVASLVMQYDLIFAKDEDEDEMDEGEDQEDEIREEKRSSDKSYVSRTTSRDRRGDAVRQSVMMTMRRRRRKQSKRRELV